MNQGSRMVFCSRSTLKNKNVNFLFSTFLRSSFCVQLTSKGLKLVLNSVFGVLRVLKAVFQSFFWSVRNGRLSAVVQNINKCFVENYSKSFGLFDTYYSLVKVAGIQSNVPNSLHSLNSLYSLYSLNTSSPVSVNKLSKCGVSNSPNSPNSPSLHSLYSRYSLCQCQCQCLRRSRSSLASLKSCAKPLMNNLCLLNSYCLRNSNLSLTGNQIESSTPKVLEVVNVFNFEVRLVFFLISFQICAFDIQQ